MMAIFVAGFISGTLLKREMRSGTGNCIVLQECEENNEHLDWQNKV
jgi:hypothetical protein